MYEVKYIVKYANGLYLGNGRKTRMVKSRKNARRFDTGEEAQKRADAKLKVHRKPEFEQWTIEKYRERTIQ